MTNTHVGRSGEIAYFRFPPLARLECFKEVQGPITLLRLCRIMLSGALLVGFRVFSYLYRHCGRCCDFVRRLFIGWFRVTHNEDCK